MRSMETTTRRDISADDFGKDAHAAKYQGELDAHADAFTRLFALLNDPANEQRLIDAEMHGLPALSGIVRFIETDPTIGPILEAGSHGFRFRQTVGVAVKLKMAKLGWRTTGRKGKVTGARYFAKAERYTADLRAADDVVPRALSALDSVAQIGDENERESTGRELMMALAATRRSEARPF